MAIIAACDRSGTQNAVQNGDKNTGILRFSKAAQVKDYHDMKSWCRRSFSEAALINADPANVNRRYFMLGDSVCQVVVRLGNMSSSFFLRKAGEKAVEVFTSDNYPMCLSDRANFAMSPDGFSFAYDNKHHIQYTVEVQPAAGPMPVVIEFKPEVQYGLTVHRCADCR